MAFLIGAAAEAMNDPGGLWEILILKVFKFIGNYGWRIVFFTVCLKLLLLPLDLFQRFKMRKNQLITERLKPQLEKLQQQYAGDRQTLSQKQMELNKREGFSYFSSCLPMIVTLVIFFYLFAGLNNISQYKNLYQYAELYDAYTVVETELKDVEFDNVQVGDAVITTSWNKLSAEQGELNAKEEKTEEDNKRITDLQRAMDRIENGYSDTNDAGESIPHLFTGIKDGAKFEMYSVKDLAQNAAVEKYGEVEESFLWVSNIWSPDVPWRKAILSHDNFISNISGYKTYSKAAKKLKINKDELDQTKFDEMISEAKYNAVTGKLRSNKDYNKVNGFLVLPLLSVGLSFLSQFITSRLQKKSGQAAPEGGMGGSMKMMMIIMPLMMGMFALSYTAMFTLYIVVNSASTILINVVTSVAMDGKSKKKEKQQTTGIQKYGRPDPKDL